MPNVGCICQASETSYKCKRSRFVFLGVLGDRTDSNPPAPSGGRGEASCVTSQDGAVVECKAANCPAGYVVSEYQVDWRTYTSTGPSLVATSVPLTQSRNPEGGPVLISGIIFMLPTRGATVLVLRTAKSGVSVVSVREASSFHTSFAI